MKAPITVRRRRRIVPHLIWLFLLVYSVIGHLDTKQAMQALIAEQERLIDVQHDVITGQEELLGEIFAVGFFDASAVRNEMVTVSAYSSTRDQTDDSPWTTADMSSVRPGIIAVSRDLIAELGLQFGQRVYLSGFGVFEIRDLMNQRWQRRVDIWCPDRTAAKLLGVNSAVMTWLDMSESEG